MTNNGLTIEQEKLLERLPGSHLDGVRFNESKACLVGTREQLIHDICMWIDSTTQECILWLSGPAGSGKSSVANSVAMIFDRRKHLGACFCFNHDTEGLNSPNNHFGNLCYQLAHFDKGLRSKVLPVIETMGHVGGSSLHTQAKKLIVETTHAANLKGPVVVVIDALDESGTRQTRNELLNAIAAEFPKLPQSVRVIITSRDEPDIDNLLCQCSKKMHMNSTMGTAKDIASYIQHRMKIIQQHSCLPPSWPSADKLQKLNSQAEQLFIWASVACNFVEDGNPVRQLNHLLNVSNVAGGSSLTQLDRLYTRILENAFSGEELEDFHYVVGSIVAVNVPLTQNGLDSLLGLGDEGGDTPVVLPDGHLIYLFSSFTILSLLQSILIGDIGDTVGRQIPVRLLHPSLHDFLTCRAERHLRINLLEQNTILAFRCLTVMNSMLKYNICGILDPSLLNNEIPNLHQQIDDCINEALHYSCCHFAYHLAEMSDPNANIIEVLKKFIFQHLLHWIEVMSLVGEISRAENCLQVLAKWIKVRITTQH